MHCVYEFEARLLFRSPLFQQIISIHFHYKEYRLNGTS